MRRTTILLALILTGPAGIAGAQDDCEGRVFDSTYDLIQEAIFENRGCTADACHGAGTAGGLDLRADVSYDNLIEAPAQTVPDSVIRGLRRVVPGQKDQSLLFLNLAAATLPEVWTAPLRSMPIGLAPLTFDELEALREWIEQGAPREGTVPGTGELLDACLPPARPIEIEPLPVPPADRGVQIRMPKWILPAKRESEVCFASYYDVSNQIPPEALSPDGESFRYKDVQIRQDPLSHHLIVDHYDGNVAADDPVWGDYRCRGGAKDGQACDPTDLEFCGDALCGSEPEASFACIGFGPADITTNGTRALLTQEASFGQAYPPGVYKEMPVRGLLIWNSHAFNLTDFDGKLEAWVNFEFAPKEEQIYPIRDIFTALSIFAMNVPAFGAQEVCRFNEFPPNTRLFELNSHTHKRGKLFRVYEGRFACDGGPNDGQPCSPEDNGIDGVDSCGGGAACVSPVPPAAGDCDGDGLLGVNDLVLSVGVALGTAAPPACWPADPDGDGRVSIADLVRMVTIALEPPTYRDPSVSRLYTNVVYNDPTVVRFDPPMQLPGRSGSRADRTFTYCALFDNGFSDPDEVKKQSTSPPLGVPAAGGPCAIPTGCTAGRVGEACSGATAAARDASCDSSPGAGDGFCDACPLRGGVTTEDEMFILMGGFFVGD